MTKVMRSKPAKHGKRLDGKRVVITRDIPGIRDMYGGVYSTEPNKDRFALSSPHFGKHILKKSDWTVEEIIETEE